MNLDDLIKELGPLTVLSHLSTVRDLQHIQEQIIRTLPEIPPPGILETNLARALTEVPRLHSKDKVIIAGPELILTELLCDMELDLEVIIAVDSCLNSEMVARISANIPTELNSRVIQIPEVPFGIRPANSVMIGVGFDGGCGYALVTETTHNILSFYRVPYLGEISLVDPLGYTVLNRPEGWITIHESQISTRSVCVRV